MASISQKLSIPMIKIQLKKAGPLPVLIAGIIISQIVYGATTIILPFFLYYGNAALDLTTIGIIMVVPSIGNFLTASPIGSLSDKIGKKPFLVMGPIIAGLSYIPFMFSGDVFVLILTSLIRGSGASMFSVPLTAYIADNAPGRQRGQMMAQFSAVNLAGSTIGYFLAGVLYTFLDIYTFIIFLAVLCIPSIIVLIRFVSPSKIVFIEQMREESPAQLVDHLSFMKMIAVLKQREFRKFVPIWFISTTLIGTVITYGPILLYKIAGNEGGGGSAQPPLLTVSFLFVAVGILTGATDLVFGKLPDRIGRKPFLFLGVVCSATIITLLAMVVNQQSTVIQTILNDPLTNLFYPLYLDFYLFKLDIPVIFFVIAAVILMIPIALFGPTSLAVVADVTKEDKTGASMGLYTALIGAGNITAALIGGFIFENFHVLGVFVFCSVLAITNVIFMLKFLYETRSIIELDGMDQLLSLWDV
ncbi:MAG: MFS transporter [Candidatus Hermodarchaeota archaeon]